MTNSQVKVKDLQKLTIFQDLEVPQLREIASSMVRRSYAPGQYIFLEGESATGLWFILKGKVKIIKHSMTGRLQGLCVVNSGKCFGSCPLFDLASNPASAQALDRVNMAILSRQDLQRLIYQDSKVAIGLLQVYNDRTQLLARLGESLGTWPVGMRINDCLLAHMDHESSEAVVEFTHEELASLVGTAREVVSRHLAELEELELIATSPGKIMLLNINALKTPCQGNIARSH